MLNKKKTQPANCAFFHLYFHSVKKYFKLCFFTQVHADEPLLK